ncbi:hypothetical protein [Streptomyces sp. NPDC048489]|uniref:hypothetical protein n=1 Tax=Streptomyces sp. NPDC048489 TaxID=3154504 RepID=UPI0034327448
MVDLGCVVGMSAGAVVIGDRLIAGLAVGVVAELVEEIGRLWRERRQAGLAARSR